ncbi:MAG: hypothetical protein DMG30_24960 [Acidobacteria bacterium]|nr:MAG: hypothetical protein DMG30_24960 [Acidobacteriota bacterium]
MPVGKISNKVFKVVLAIHKMTLVNDFAKDKWVINTALHTPLSVTLNGVYTRSTPKGRQRQLLLHR